MSKEQTQREVYIDIAKSILIFFVVLGHSGFMGSKYIYWFHMPAFFILSGYLMKSKNSTGYFAWIKNKAIKLMVPYIVFSIVCIVVLYIRQPFPIGSLGKIIFSTVKGGRLLAGVFGVFWFITCLLVSEVIFKFIVQRFNIKTICIMALIMYVLAHVESYYIKDIGKIYVPWNIDVCLLAVPYMTIGFLLKNNLNAFLSKKSVILIALFIAVSAVILDAFGVIKYALDLKHVHYHDPLLDILIPVSFFILIIFISKIKSSGLLARSIGYIGRYSLLIMYLHIPINFLLQKWFHYNFIVFCIAGIGIPIIFSYFISRYRVTRALFLGEMTY